MGEDYEVEVITDRMQGVDTTEPTYPCSKCGKLRTKAEGGTIFTVCDGCWDAPSDR